MTFGIPGWHGVDDDVEARVRKLSKEVAALTRMMARGGGHAADEARDGLAEVVADLSDRVSDLLPVIRKRGRAIEQTAREHPAVAAAVGVVVVGLALGLLLRRRPE